MVECQSVCDYFLFLSIIFLRRVLKTSSPVSSIGPSKAPLVQDHNIYVFLACGRCRSLKWCRRLANSSRNRLRVSSNNILAETETDELDRVRSKIYRRSLRFSASPVIQMTRLSLSEINNLSPSQFNRVLKIGRIDFSK